MGICLLLVILANESLHKRVADALSVNWHTLALENGESHLKLILRLLADVPNFANVACFRSRVDVQPEVNHTLVELAALVVELSRLDRFLVDGLPLWVKEPVIQVDRRLSNQVVAEHQVVIVGLNHEWGRPREAHVEVVAADEFGVGLIILIIILRAFRLVSASHDEEGITG